MSFSSKLIKNFGLEFSNDKIFENEEEKLNYINLAKKLIKQKININKYNNSENDKINICLKTEFLDELENKLQLIKKKKIIESEEYNFIKKKVFEDNFENYGLNNNLIMDNLIKNLEDYNKKKKLEINNLNKERYLEQQQFEKEISIKNNNIEDVLKLKSLKDK